MPLLKYALVDQALLVEEEEEDMKSYLLYRKQEDSLYDAKEGTVRNDTSVHRKCDLYESVLGVKKQM